MNELEIRKEQKRFYAMLKKASENPSDIQEMLEDFKLEMVQEDVALVDQNFEKRKK